MNRDIVGKVARLFLIVCSVTILATRVNAIDVAAEFSDPVLQARYQHLTRELRCLVCQNETIADSSVQLAGDLRREVRGLLSAGKSDEEIIKFLTDRYGDFVLYNPPFVARTWLLWIAPVIALVIGAISVGIIVRRRATMSIDIDGDSIDQEKADIK